MVITGHTRDQDGKASVRGRVYVLEEGSVNVIWLEDYGTLKALCRGTVNRLGSSIEGTYRATSGVTGTLECSLRGRPKSYSSSK